MGDHYLGLLDRLHPDFLAAVVDITTRRTHSLTFCLLRLCKPFRPVLETALLAGRTTVPVTACPPGVAVAPGLAASVLLGRLLGLAAHMPDAPTQVTLGTTLRTDRPCLTFRAGVQPIDTTLREDETGTRPTVPGLRLGPRVLPAVGPPTERRPCRATERLVVTTATADVIPAVVVFPRQTIPQTRPMDLLLIATRKSATRLRGSRPFRRQPFRPTGLRPARVVGEPKTVVPYRPLNGVPDKATARPAVGTGDKGPVIDVVLDPPEEGLVLVNIPVEESDRRGLPSTATGRGLRRATSTS